MGKRDKRMDAYIADSPEAMKLNEEGISVPKTKASGIEQAIEWMAEGKIRNWKYLK